MTGQADHQIAIVGLACRFPGASDPVSFWSMLADGHDAVREIPVSRWELTGGAKPRKSWCAGLISNIADFDADFFGISLHEGRLMDPQQRLLMEVSWEALESAGMARERLAGSRSGVFVGISAFDYSLIQSGAVAHSGTGNALSIAANRISYFLDLRGPSIAVDTACSSSLVATHLAVESLRRREVDLALTAGVNAILSAEVFSVLDEAGMLAPDGRCKTFDARADGYVRGEGCGVVVLKRLQDAQRDGDQILAVIRGTAVNQDGKSNGLTAPNGPAQEALIAATLSDAGLAPTDIDYVEAHGTGTALGDPIEALALNAALSKGRDPAEPCLVGSVKTNIGHLEAAAGIAALIKVTLALHHRQIPVSLHYSEPNPRIPFDSMALRVASALQPWPKRVGIPRAGVSSFGFGGTNAHVILEAASETPLESADPEIDGPSIVTVSAPTSAALQERLRGLQTWRAAFSENPPPPLNLAYMTSVRRSHFKHRWACVVRDRDGLARCLDAGANGAAAPGVVAGVRKPGGAPSLVFVYSGQGADFAGMGSSLFRTFEPFRETFEACDKAAQAAGGNLLRHEMVAGKGGASQPVQVALQIALTALWAAFGVHPDAVIGQSLGEISAAWAAGILPLENAMRLAVLRENAMSDRRGNGEMISVQAASQEVAALISGLHGEAGIAAINGPATTVVFASAGALDGLIHHIETAGFDFQRVRTECAYHSPQMDGAREELTHRLAGLSPQNERIPFFSTLLGRRTSGLDLDAKYWGCQLREPVQFASAVASVAGEYAPATFLELGGHPVLSAALQQCLAAIPGDFRILGTLRRNLPEGECLLRTVASLYAEGRTISWNAVHPRRPRRWLDLPSYPWEHKPCWTARPAAHTLELQPHPSAPARQPEIVSEATANREAILNELRGSVAGILGTTPEEVNIHKPFIEMGADSILLALAAQRIQKRYGVQIRLRQFFDDLSNIDSLANFLVVNAKVAQPTPARIASATPKSDADESVQALLHRQLDLLSEVMRQQLEVIGKSATQSKAKAPLAVTPPPAPHPTGLRDFGPYRPPWPGAPEESSGGLTDRQQLHLDDLIRRYTARTPRSKARAADWRQRYADCRASAGFRPSIKEMLYPIEGERAEGSKMWDVDGNVYLDISMDFGVNIFGHKARFIEEAVAEQLSRGFALSSRSRHAGEVAALICELTGMERAVFCQSGTEAVMTAVRLARLATGRSRIAFFTGSYHGHFDGFLASASGDPGDFRALPAAPGIAPEIIAGAMVLPYGDEKSLAAVRDQGASLAAVLVEPIQSRHPDFHPSEFLRELRKITRESGILLIFDEMITGFRAHPGGVQALFGIDADLATYGKVLGGGQPIAAVAGRAEFLDGIDGGPWNYGDASFPAVETTFFAGTFCGNPLALASARAVLLELKRRGPGFQKELSAMTERFATGLNDWFAAKEVPIRIVHFSSLFRFAYKGNLDLLFYHLIEKGVFIWEGRNCFFSGAHDERDIESLAARIQESVSELQQGGFIPEKSTASVAAPEFAPARASRIQMTEAQRQLWVAAQVDPLANEAYTETLVLRCYGRLDAELLQRAFQAVISRHESLRTSYSDDGRFQVIDPFAAPDFRAVDGSGLQGSELERARAGFMLEMTGRPVDLRQVPLVRMGVFRLTADSQLIVLSGHHIVIDGWSINLLINDLALHYTVELGQTPAPPPAVMQYRDYAAWLDEALRGPEMARQESFWRERVSELPHLTLPHDLPKQPRWGWRGARISTRLSHSVRDKLEALGRAQGATLFMTLLAGWQTLLHRLAAQDDIIIGCPVLGRSMPRAMEIVGYLTHLLPIRSHCVAQESFVDFLRSSRTILLDAFEHQDYPFSHIIRLLGRSNDPGEPTFIRATFNLDRPREGPRFGGLKCEILSPDIRAAKFELSLNVIDLHGELLLDLDYNRDLFSPELAAVIQKSFVGWLRQIAENPVRPLASMRLEFDPMRPPAGSATPSIIAGSTLDQAFAYRAAQLPEAVCLIAARVDEGPEAGLRMSYSEVDARAGGLATALVSLGVRPKDSVGLSTSRGAERIVGLLGVLKTGAAAVPLDPNYPEERLRFMLEDCGVAVVVCEPPSQERFARLGWRTAVLDGSQRNGVGIDRNAIAPSSPDSVACVFYTSGSTGVPKGVAVTHRNILSLLNAMAARSDNPGGAMLHHSSFSFDASTWEIWWPLLAGGPLVIAPPGELTLAALARCVRDYQVCDGFFTTGLFNRLVDFEGDTLARMDRIATGGSTASCKHFGALLDKNPALSLLNIYGPTECTTFSTIHTAKPEDASAGRMPIGAPLAGLHVYVLDRFLQPAPNHVPGELFIGGASVAQGYVNRPGLTAERFIPNPFSEQPGKRLYRTGDRVRRLANGCLEFLGRLDDQVKVNGFRVELGEVEAALQGHPEIGQCLAAVLTDDPTDHRLVAYYVAQGGAIDHADLRAFLAERLPGYLIPSFFVCVQEILLDSNGKPDRKSLPTPDFVTSLPVQDVPPETECEKQLAPLWRRLLKRDTISRGTDFFESGGHSLLVAELVAEISREFSVSLSLREVYENPTFAACARVLQDRLGQGKFASPIPRVSRSGRRERRQV